MVANYSLLYKWPGQDEHLKPLLLLAHMDVVPVEPGTEGAWTQPAFEGRIADGYVWGRGAIDDKAAVVGILEAVEQLLREGYQPRRTIYLAFGHDEELGGPAGAPALAALLDSRGVTPEYVLDDIDTPALLLGGWVDFFLRGTTRAFLTVQGPKRLVVGVRYAGSTTHAPASLRRTVRVR